MTCGVAPELTNRQGQHDTVATWLQNYSPSLAELYIGAYALTYQIAVPGRVRFISHAVREIRNRLPDVIAGYKGGEYLDYKSRLDVISIDWQASRLPLGSTSLVEETGATTIAIPLKHVAQIGQLINDHMEVRETVREAARRLFEACDPGGQPAGETLTPILKGWLSTTDWFMHLTHDPGGWDQDVDFVAVRRKFELFEDALYGLSGAYFETLRPLDEILENTNRS